MARPVRPGTGTTRRMSEASEPAKQIGTVFADPIRASSRHPAASTGRTEDCTRPTRQNIKSALAMWEPSTEVLQDIEATNRSPSGSRGFMADLTSAKSLDRMRTAHQPAEQHTALGPNPYKVSASS